MKRVKYENPEGAAPAQGLYSHAARVSAGDLLFVAGQLAVAPDGGVVGKNDFAAQFQRVFDNLGDVLKGPAPVGRTLRNSRPIWCIRKT